MNTNGRIFKGKNYEAWKATIKSILIGKGFDDFYYKNNVKGDDDYNGILRLV